MSTGAKRKTERIFGMKKTIFLLTLVLTLSLAVFTQSAFASAPSALKQGASSYEVTTLQTILKNQGYFNSEITGYYGTETKNAVIKFQKANGLTADGIFGTNTRNALYSAASQHYLRTYDDNDIYWLSRLIEAEAQGESYTGKVAVGNCVLNRVITDSYPNNVVKVIFDTNYGVQYQPTKNGAIYNTPSQSSVNAAIAALEGARPVGKCLFFYNPRTGTSSWIKNNRQYYTSIGNHDFHI